MLRFAFAAICLLSLSEITRADFDVDVDRLNSHQIEMTLDRSHDLVFLSQRDGRLHARIYMFDPTFFPHPPSPQLSHDELRKLADTYEERDRRLDSFTVFIVSARAGNDYIIADNTVTKELWLKGEDGDDYLQGGTGDDGIEGGYGDDWMVGGDGEDFLNGGPYLYRSDGNLDIYEGGAGRDIFVDYYRWVWRTVPANGSLQPAPIARVRELEDWFFDYDPAEDTLYSRLAH